MADKVPNTKNISRKHSFVGVIESKLQSSGLRRSATTTSASNLAGGSAGSKTNIDNSTESINSNHSLNNVSASNSAPASALTNDENIYSMNVDDYVMGEPIGYGSSAVVYIADYKPLNTKVAIKMIDLDMFERNQIDELRREIQIMSLSRHPNLLPVYGSFVNESKLYIVTPYLSAGSCLDITKTAFPDGFDEVSIAIILKQALEGLVYLHKNGLIHRDVKAGNLLMDEGGLVQLADFGVSSSLMETGERKGIRKTFVGTPCWMAPEVMEQSGYDYKADIWSFGITALELATGHAPFAKYPPLKVLMLTLQNSPPTLDRDSAKHKFSKVFKDMIDSCLQKDPTKRPSAEKLLTHPFFKQAKKIQYLVQSVLNNLPPVTERSHLKRKAEQPSEDKQSETWDFSSNEDTVRTQKSGKVGFGNITIINDEEAAALERQRRMRSGASGTSAGVDTGSTSEGTETSSHKPSRFIVDPEDQDYTSSPGSLSHSNSLQQLQAEQIEFKKGRFSVNQGSGDDHISTQDSTDRKKSSRFAVQTSVTDTNNSTPGLNKQSSSRFLVSNDSNSGTPLQTPTASASGVTSTITSAASATPTKSNDRRGRFEVTQSDNQ